MKRAVLLAGVIAFLGCKDKGSSAPKEQTFREGMQLFCDGLKKPTPKADPSKPVPKLGAGVAPSGITNAEVLAVMKALASANPADRAMILVDATSKAGIADCKAPAVDPFASFALPDVGDAQLQPLDDGTTVLVSPTAITLEGNELVAVKGGAAQPPDVEKTAQGDTLPRLAAAAQAGSGPLLVVVDPGTTAGLLLEVLGSVKDHYTSIALVARARSGVGTIPISLTLPTPSDDHPILVVTITKDGAIAVGPDVVAPADLHAKLEDLHGKGARPVAVRADDSVTAATVVPVIARVRESFGDVLLSTSLQ